MSLLIPMAAATTPAGPDWSAWSAPGTPTAALAPGLYQVLVEIPTAVAAPPCYLGLVQLTNRPPPPTAVAGRYFAPSYFP